MRKMKVGARVRVVRDFGSARQGMTGTVVVHDYDVGVALDVDDPSRFHDCSGYCKDGCGQWIDPHCLQEIPGDPLNVAVEAYIFRELGR